MAQVSWRAPDELVDRVRHVARRHGRSLNDYITRVLDAATDPDLSGDEAARLRARLDRAGLLAAPGTPRSRPRGSAVERARARAGAGTTLAELVQDGRR